MTITSDSTLNDVLAQYNNNLDWDGDPAKAKLCLAALRWLLVNRPASHSTGGRQLNYESLESEKQQLETYVGKVTRTGPSFTRGVCRVI